MENNLTQENEGSNKHLLAPIPDRRYFSISDVATLCNVRAHVLRYWQTQFSQLRPSTRLNRRYYTHDDILLVRHIYDLLYRQCFTIKGARAILKNSKNTRSSITVQKNTETKKRLFPFLSSRRKLHTHTPADVFNNSPAVDKSNQATTELSQNRTNHDWIKDELHLTLALLRGKPND